MMSAGEILDEAIVSLGKSSGVAVFLCVAGEAVSMNDVSELIREDV